MTNLVIQSTDSTPHVEFLTNGALTLKGRSLPEDVHKFYAPLIDWVKHLETDKVVIDLKLQYSYFIMQVKKYQLLQYT